jgi:hypothetical protein
MEAFKTKEGMPNFLSQNPTQSLIYIYFKFLMKIGNHLLKRGESNIIDRPNFNQWGIIGLSLFPKT